MSMLAQVRRVAATELADLVRDPNPILVKELRSTFRTKLFIRFLYLSTGLVGIIVLSGGAGTAAGSLPPAEVGQILEALIR